MPEAGEQPHDGNIPKLHRKPPAVAAQRDVHIVAEPRAHGDVPPPPEIRNALRAVGVVEVFKEVKAEQLPEADRHIRIAGKVEIDLKREGKDPEPRGDDRQVARL